MVEQIKELGAETQILPFAELKRLAEREVDIHLLRADDAIARRISKTGGAVRGVRDSGRLCIGGGVDPVCDFREEAAGIHSVAPIEAGSEIGRSYIRGVYNIGQSASRILNR